jgi:chemotaxis protein methyltransferase CheR
VTDGQKPLEDIEIEVLLQGIRSRYGYDFQNYSYASLKRRLFQAAQRQRTARLTELLDRLFHDECAFSDFLSAMSVTVTEMFRDPPFYAALREKVVPLLRTFPYIKVWHAGCSTGEEVYSMAILLHEENFLSRSRLYATDFNKRALHAAQTGIYPAKNIPVFAANYRAAGGRSEFTDYYSEGYERAKFKDYLKENITFSYHNLVNDGHFGEMNLILCRNVLIYFDRTLQNRVLSVFAESLRHGGFLCLGNKETLNFTEVKHLFEPVDAKCKIYRKCGPMQPGNSL